MKVIWTPEALRDREDIWDYLVERSPVSAIEIDDLFALTAERLQRFPYLGHEGDILGTREFIPHELYRLVYEIVPTDPEQLWILALVHTSRLWPPVSE